jgi:hypothetical protein
LPGRIHSEPHNNRQKAGTVTLFAFDEGQGLSEHTAPYDALVYILDGEANVRHIWQAYSTKERRNDHNARQRAARSEGRNKVQDDSDNGKVLTVSSSNLNQLA